MKKFSLLLATLIFWVSQCLAGTYYSANDTASENWSAAQNIDTPCTIATAMTNAIAGDTVYFRGGNYEAPLIGGEGSAGYTPAFEPSNSGTSGSPITFKAYPDEIPFIDNTNNYLNAESPPCFGVYGHDWIVWDGFHTEAVSDPNNMSKGVIFYNADHCTLKNCNIEGYTSGVSNNICIRSEHTIYLTIENNILFNSLGDSKNSAAYQSYDTSNTLMYNNDIYDCWCGIYDKSDCQYNKYYRNFIRDCQQAVYINVKGKSCNGAEVYQNVIINQSNEAIAVVGHGDDNGVAQGFKFYNNVVEGSARGISFGYQSSAPGNGHNQEAYNNIVFDSSCGMRTFTGFMDILDYNNYYNVTSWNIDSYSGTDYTTLGDWQAGTGHDMNSTIANPNFENINGTSAEDFKLQAGSPALTLGVDRQDYDSDGNTTEVIPAGAYITGSETIGYSANGNGNGGSSTGSVISGITPSGGTF